MYRQKKNSDAIVFELFYSIFTYRARLRKNYLYITYVYEYGKDFHKKIKFTLQIFII